MVSCEIIQEFRYWFDTRNQKVITGASAGDVEQMALGVIDLLQVGIVANRFDPFLQRNYFVIAGHHGYGPKLEPFGEVHSADRDVPGGGFDMLIEDLESNPRILHSGARTIQLPYSSDEHAEFVR
jgi:hypothetical protein